MTFLGIIEDGYTKQFTIHAVPGIHDTVSGEYRPFTVKQKARAQQDMRHLELDAQQEKAAAHMVKQLVSWTIPMDINEANLLKLTAMLFDRLWVIINGVDAGDVIDAKN